MKFIRKILDYVLLIIAVLLVAGELLIQIEKYGAWTILTFPACIVTSAIGCILFFMLCFYTIYIIMYKKFTGFKDWFGKTLLNICIKLLW